MKYFPLNVKTNYELLSSLIKIDDLISFLHLNNISTVGVTDSNMFSCMELYNKCKKNNIKLVIGIEIKELGIYIYARNYDGYISLCNIVSKKNIDSITYEDIKVHSNNVIVVIPYKKYEELNNMFDYVYVYYTNELEKKNALFYTKNVVYLPEILCLNESDNEFLSYLELIKNKKTINDKLLNYASHYKENYNDFDIKSTIEFASNINIIFPEVKKHIPIFRENSYKYLVALAKKGLEKRLNGNVSEVYKERLMFELNTIESMGYTDYFLIVYDFILFAKKNNIMVGPGRGSAAGSLVSYCLGITLVDPLKYGLIFERFLNPERVSMPDIDVDFDNTRRDEVIDYIKNKYGKEYVSNIISFDTLLPKQVLRDVGRILNVNEYKIDTLCKMINKEENFQELKTNNSFISFVKRDKEVKELVRIANKICGIKKNTSTHAAGIVISNIKLQDIIPLYKRDGVILTCYSKEYIESLGLLKMDLLSVENLNIIFNIINKINEYEEFDINKIDLNDKKTLDIFKNGNTMGIFQFESSGMISLLKNLKVDNFDVLVNAIALYRPGPKDMIPSYINRKEGKEKVIYPIKELESILSCTYGIMIYQEQVIEILKVIGGYSRAKADIIRRAMSSKRLNIIESEKKTFIKGGMSKGYDRDTLLDLYNKIIKFSGYGFNKSHSVVYALLAYQMAYLKAHYPLYFFTYMLNMNKSSDKIKLYINEAKNNNISIVPASINNSTSAFEVIDDKIILPLSIIKNIDNNTSTQIVKEREKGAFKSFYDFMIRCFNNIINEKKIISLIECSCFNEFNINKKEIINNMEIITNYISLCKDVDLMYLNEPILEEYKDYTDIESIDLEINNYGFYLSKHPVYKFDRTNKVKINEISKHFNKVVNMILLVENIKTINTKKDEKMSFVKLSDEFGYIEGVIFPKNYNRLNIEKGKIYLVIANVEKRNDSFQLIISNMELL